MERLLLFSKWLMQTIKIKVMTYMDRKAAEFWWNIPIKGRQNDKPFVAPRNVARYEKENPQSEWKIITWSDIHKQRTEKIQRIIEFKRMHPVIKPCLLWVFDNQGRFPFGGIYAAIHTIKGETFYLNFKKAKIKNRQALQLKAMQCFPLVIPMIELFDHWMQLFCETYKNKKFFAPRDIQGVAKCWCKFDEYGYLVDIANKKSDII